MGYFIRLTIANYNGEDPYIYVALNKVTTFYREISPNVTVIRLVDGYEFNVKETPEDIIRTINQIDPFSVVASYADQSAMQSAT